MTNKPDLTLFLGGIRSGKSARAEALASRSEGPVLYVATAEARPDDPSMTERIRRHCARRPGHWRTLECPLRLAEHIGTVLEGPAFRIAGKPAVSSGRSDEVGGGVWAESGQAGDAAPTILVDCVPLWVSNILFSLPDPEDVTALEAAVRLEVDALLRLIDRAGGRWIVVSGETGLGGIDPTRIGRAFCDGLGLANQRLAARARDVFLVMAGRVLALEA